MLKIMTKLCYRPDGHCWKPVPQEQGLLLLAVTGTSAVQAEGVGRSSHGNPLHSSQQIHSMCKTTFCCHVSLDCLKITALSFTKLKMHITSPIPHYTINSGITEWPRAAEQTTNRKTTSHTDACMVSMQIL